MNGRDRSAAAFPTLASARDAHWTARPDTAGVLNLKSCEMQLPSATKLLAEVLAEVGPDIVSRYPYQQATISKFAAADEVDTESVMLAAGSYSAIALIVDALAVPARRLLVQEPVFEGWLHFAALRAVPITRCLGVRGRPIEVCTLALERAMRTSEPAVVALTNPGNPTGVLLPLDEVARLARVASGCGHLLVIDECYAAFNGTSHVPLIQEHPNLIVLRSLSKSFALAGGRLALIFGHPLQIDYLRRFAVDSSVAGPTLALAHRLLDRMDELKSIWREIACIRDAFSDLVIATRPDWTPLPSVANFVTFDTGRSGGGRHVEQYLAARHIRVRSVEDVPGFNGCVRFSLAAPDIMRRVADQLPVYDSKVRM